MQFFPNYRITLTWHLAVTMLQMPHVMGGFGLTPNVLAKSTAKVAMASRFVGFVGSLPPEEQTIRLPNQLAHDPQTWVAPNLLQLKSEYEILLNKHNCKEQESYIVQDQSLPPSDTLLLPPLLQGSSAKSGAASDGGFSTGYVTITTYTVQAGDEEYGILGGQH